jgi:hypothetical protein
LRLSRAGKQPKHVSPEAGEQPEPLAQVAAPPRAAETLAADTDSDSAAVLPFEPEHLDPVREKRKLKLRKDLLKACKRIARAQDRKLYQVIEAALESYIERHGAGE